MSRHRTMRARCDSAMQDDDAEYGRSVEDVPFSPSMSGYLYQREQRANQIGNYMAGLNQSDEEGDNEIKAHSRHDSDEQQALGDSQNNEMFKMAISESEDEQLHACLDKMREVLGASTYSEELLKEAAIRCNFDANSAIQHAMDTSSARSSEAVNNNKKDTKMSGILPHVSIPRGASGSALAPLACDVTTAFGKPNPTNKDSPLKSGLLTRARTDVNIVGMQQTVVVDARGPRTSLRPQAESSAMEKRVSGLQIASQGTLRTDSPARLFQRSSSNRSDSPSVTPSPKSGGADKSRAPNFPPANERPQLNLVVVGHVDAGKSTLMGHLLHKLNVVTSKELRKNEQEAKKAGKASFSFAWVLDQNAEERKRGITMDIAQTRFSTANKDVTLLDAPGHKDFIPNMIVGAAQADAAILVVNATRGEFESGFDAGGQTREHAILVRSCGITQLVVAVNQLDKVDYDQARFEDIKAKLALYLRTQIGFREDDMRFVPVSGFSGENLSAKPSDSRFTAWYIGPSLADAIDGIRPPERAVAKPLRLFVVDAFKPTSGAGLCVAGTVVAGRCAVGDRLTVMPLCKSVAVKAIAKELASAVPSTESTATSLLPPGFCSVDAAFAGDSVTMTLTGLDSSTNERAAGWILCEPSQLIRVTQRVRAQVVVLQTDALVTRGMPIEAYMHSVCEPASVTKLVALLNRATGTVLQKHPKLLERGQTGLVEIAFERTVCVELYSDYKELGRITLRHRGDTIAAGIIVDIAKLKPVGSND